MNGYDENNNVGMNEMNQGQQSFISPEQLQAQIDSEKRMQEEMAKAQAQQTADETDAQAKAAANAQPSVQPQATTYTYANDQAYTQQTAATFTQTNASAGPQEENSAKAKKAKKERKPMPAIGKFALGGAVFGLCGALVFSGVMVISNHTFLKKDTQEIARTADNDDDSMAERKEEKSEKASDDSFAGRQDKEEEAEIGESKTLPTTNTSDAATISEITQSVMPSIVSITVKGVEEVQSMFGTQKYEAEGAGSGITALE